MPKYDEFDLDIQNTKVIQQNDPTSGYTESATGCIHTDMCYTLRQACFTEVTCVSIHVCKV